MELYFGVAKYQSGNLQLNLNDSQNKTVNVTKWNEISLAKNCSTWLLGLIWHIIYFHILFISTIPQWLRASKRGWRSGEPFPFCPNNCYPDQAIDLAYEADSGLRVLKWYNHCCCNGTDPSWTTNDMISFGFLSYSLKPCVKKTCYNSIDHCVN